MYAQELANYAPWSPKLFLKNIYPCYSGSNFYFVFVIHHHVGGEPITNGYAAIGAADKPEPLDAIACASFQK